MHGKQRLLLIRRKETSDSTLQCWRLHVVVPLNPSPDVGWIQSKGLIWRKGLQFISKPDLPLLLKPDAAVPGDANHVLPESWQRSQLQSSQLIRSIQEPLVHSHQSWMEPSMPHLFQN
eukprot:CAMPEP_0194523812 /NCGR_PEP_ID=MMETSP0253-20130528/58824_1 /TAXON_ID=2966 /ORGANISM="Noctiluca scintillans" /LENGTH=117 /DNA_ID=CAMNT_0039368383 /DNA_START=437 /DNA_END=790 /DNA_ORIENTATION=+